MAWAFLKRRKVLVWVSLGALLVVIFLPMVIPEFYVYLLTEILILGLFGLSVNLLVGYSGMVTFGHAAFYGVGAYTVGLLLVKTGTPFPVAMLAAPLVAAVFGLVIGFFCVRLTGFYFAILTLAFGMLVWSIIYKWISFTGGDNGLVGVVIPSVLSSAGAFYYFTVGIFVVCSVALWFIVNSRFGCTMRAIRENPERVHFLGINVTNYRLVAFMVAAFFAGIAGGLYTAFTHGAFPDFASWMKSGDGLIIALIGGMFSFVGPLVGAAVLLVVHHFVTMFTEYWSLVLGIILVLVVLFLPGGVMEIGTKIKLALPVVGGKASIGGLAIRKFRAILKEYSSSSRR